MGRAIQSADRSIYYFFGYFQGNWALDRIASQLESDTLLKTGPVISLLWYFWFRSDGDPYERRTTILTILTGTFLGLVVTRLLATLTPFRTRPIYEAGLVHHAFSMPMPSYFSQMSSFPSDHGTGGGYWCATREIHGRRVMLTGRVQPKSRPRQARAAAPERTRRDKPTQALAAG